MAHGRMFEAVCNVVQYGISRASARSGKCTAGLPKTWPKGPRARAARSSVTVSRPPPSFNRRRQLLLPPGPEVIRSCSRGFRARTLSSLIWMTRWSQRKPGMASRDGSIRRLQAGRPSARRAAGLRGSAHQACITDLPDRAGIDMHIISTTWLCARCSDASSRRA